ncbi:hypothetical protein ABT116_10400, partial [Streptomyces sp. NPDC002130]|uniref:hypothetical protein n=1 Tax=Streptomyces sp. NPDC002130 TaxID=3155568 RepID=UPI00332093F9
MPLVQGGRADRVAQHAAVTAGEGGEGDRGVRAPPCFVPLYASERAAGRCLDEVRERLRRHLEAGRATTRKLK